jgi:histidine triad (HIT) family protein
MELTEEQIKQLKKQVIEQIKKTFPEEKRKEAIDKINAMSKQEFEAFVKQNNLVQDQEQPQNSQEKTPINNSTGQQCIFCSIASGQTPSFKFAEDKKAVAVLELNPLSKGHTLILPKKHIEKPENLPSETQELTNKVTKLLKEKLNPRDIKLTSNNIMGHESINLIPIYETEPKERKQANKEELLELQKKLSSEREIIPEKQEPEKIPEKKEKIEFLSKKNNWLPKRIP